MILSFRMKLGGHIQKMHRLLREWPCTGCGIVLRKHSELSEHVKICQTPAIFPPAAAAVAAQEEEEALEDAAGSSQESVHETAATVEAIKATSTEKTVEVFFFPVQTPGFVLAHPFYSHIY